jgi:isoaspartyl peptidase/L-asparaginase-like protein (Ntn-hydrolase superfamily)
LLINIFLTIQQNVEPDPTKFCGPYKPNKDTGRTQEGSSLNHRSVFSDKNHDTIGMVAIDTAGRIAAGTSTNGAKFKIPG